MAYVDGYVLAVPAANRQQLIDYARRDGKRMIFDGFVPVLDLKA